MRVAVIFYDGVEPIDLGVVGVLSMAKRVTSDLEYFTVSEAGGAVELQNGLKVLMDYSFEGAPYADVFIVTGGPGWKVQATNERMLAFLRKRAAESVCAASVCTGSMLLGAAGLLKARLATTKTQVVPPEINPLEALTMEYGAKGSRALVVDDGDIVTGGGVTLGIDTTFYLLERFLGRDVASETARIMEYSAALVANKARLSIVRGSELSIIDNVSCPE
jgi:transcriptional regulator GlxA family with amidase domain